MKIFAAIYLVLAIWLIYPTVPDRHTGHGGTPLYQMQLADTHDMSREALISDRQRAIDEGLRTTEVYGQLDEKILLSGAIISALAVVQFIVGLQHKQRISNKAQRPTT